MDLNSLSFAVIGGDTRMVYAAQTLYNEGYKVKRAATELNDTPCGVPNVPVTEAAESDVLIFGLPFSKDGKTLYAPFGAQTMSVREPIGDARSNRFIFAGMLSSGRCEHVFPGPVTDYYYDEPFTLFNAMLTAEALVMHLMRALPCALFGTEIAVLGYGRIGAYLTRMLLSLGARVTVFARSPVQLASAALNGAAAVPLQELGNVCSACRALVNTVPAAVCGKKELCALAENCLLIECASPPYGIDAAAAERMGFSYTLAAGLPGKYAPEAAGAAVAHTVTRRLREVIEDGAP